MNLVSPIPPSVNHYLGYRGVIKNGKPVAVSYKTQEAVKYANTFREYVIAEVEQQGWVQPESRAQHFYADAVFYFDNAGRDTNNYFKVMLDAITDTGLVWPDDNVVCERVKRIYYDAENPRIELMIYPVDYIGIFDNASQLEEFKKSCIDCSRSKRNCSVLRKATEGRIQTGVSNTHCDKYVQRKGEKGNGKEKESCHNERI